MCLAIPMRVRKISQDFAQVESAKVVRQVNIQLLPELKAGDYVIVHAGFAIERLDPQQAKETLRIVERIQ
jgi:hydrogenase expression/formation protein HypC